MVLLLVLLCAALWASLVLLWLRAQRRKFHVAPYKHLFNLIQNPGTILTFQNRTDLTGAYSQLVLLVVGLAVLSGRKVLIPPFGENYNLEAFEVQGIGYDQVSSVVDKEDHIANNAACVDRLGLSAFCIVSIPENVLRIDIKDWKSVMLGPLLRRPMLINLGQRTQDLLKLIQRGAGGIDNVFTEEVRCRLNEAYMRANGIEWGTPDKKRKPVVCIHARHGEVCDMPKRFIPSGEYQNLLVDLRTIIPGAEIHLYSTRWCESDSPQVFLDHGVIMHIDDTGVFETWQKFILADVFVTARSSFSAVPAMLKHDSIVVYRKSGSPPLRDWVRWDASGIIDRPDFEQRCRLLPGRRYE
jgi:hypothetical protein